jgi:hypothetical protein
LFLLFSAGIRCYRSISPAVHHDAASFSLVLLLSMMLFRELSDHVALDEGTLGYSASDSLLLCIILLEALLFIGLSWPVLAKLFYLQVDFTVGLMMLFSFALCRQPFRASVIPPFEANSIGHLLLVATPLVWLTQSKWNALLLLVLVMMASEGIVLFSL